MAEWWSECDLATFKARIAAAFVPELETLSAELSAAQISLNAQLSAPSPSADPDWRHRAIRAQGHLAQRRKLVKAELSRRIDEHRVVNKSRKAQLCQAARRKLEAGDVKSALGLVIDWLDPNTNEREDANG